MKRDNIFAHRHGGTALILVLFLAVSFGTRSVLLFTSHDVVTWSWFGIFSIFFWGFLYDLAAASYLAIPVALYLMLLPQRIFTSRLHRILSVAFFFVVLYGLLFIAAAEWFFWDEFGVRFNFIAVDYLIYTKEVVGNIYESYPLVLILSALFLLTVLLTAIVYRFGRMRSWFESTGSWKVRSTWTGCVLLAAVLFTATLDNRTVPGLGNSYNEELAKNGPYSFVAAFRNNELEYDQFYRAEDNTEAFRQIRALLKTENSTYISQEPYNITRFIENEGEEKRYNVIQITVESLSAEYLGVFGNIQGLTPNLDALSEESILFTNCFATGTRTVRGMEALVLSVPPTPGRSIVKRPNNEDLFSLGSIFRSKGYDTAFIYSGFGYFDNMNHFFANNGYRVVDRASVPQEAITFANVWGACDEDLYNWVLDEADRSYAQDKPFMHFVMTTSNHRPFTYPEGKIDIPSHSGRRGGVKYTDYAIGELIRKAKERPWFSNTLFVIVADHCAGSAGKMDLPVRKYRIPLMIYNPELLQPRRVERLCSQIDFAPTLLGLLHWSYESQFYGKDILRMEPDSEYALIGTYQKLGYMKQNLLTVLKPIREVAAYRFDLAGTTQAPAAEDADLTKQAIAYYQTASFRFNHR